MFDPEAVEYLHERSPGCEAVEEAVLLVTSGVPDDGSTGR